MDTNQIIKEFKATLDEKLDSKEFSQETVASMSKLFSDVIKEKSEEYISNLEKVEAEKQEAEKAHESLQETISDVETKLKETEEKLSGLEADNAARDAELRFSARMEALDEIYQLDEEDRKILAAEVASLDDTDEVFASYQDKLSKIWAHKDKDRIGQLAKEMEEKIQKEVEKRLGELQPSKASKPTEPSLETEKAEEVLNNVESEKVEMTNNNAEVSEEPSLRERFAETFRDSITISY